MIKQLCIGIFCLSLFPATAGAAGWHFGIKGGMNAGTTKGKDEISPSKYRKAPVAGLEIARLLNDWFGLQAEVNYSGKGVRDTNSSPSTSVNLTFVEVPVLARLTYKTGRKDAPYLLLGGYYGVLLSASTVSTQTMPDLNVETDIKSFLNGGEAGVITALGMAFPIGAVKILLEIRWTGGLTNIIKPVPGTVSTRDPDLRTSTGSFMTGISF